MFPKPASNFTDTALFGTLVLFLVAAAGSALIFSSGIRGEAVATDGKLATVEEQKVIAWRVGFEDGSVELWRSEDIKGEPAFGRWVTPLVAGGPAVDLAPKQDGE